MAKAIKKTVRVRLPYQRMTTVVVDGIVGDSYTTGNKVPRLHLIPRCALLDLTERLELGVATHAEKSWNAISSNQECLLDDHMLLERGGHCLDHVSKAIAILSGQMPDDGDNHAGAILWFGAFLSASMKARDAAKPPKM